MMHTTKFVCRFPNLKHPPILKKERFCCNKNTRGLRSRSATCGTAAWHSFVSNSRNIASIGLRIGTRVGYKKTLLLSKRKARGLWPCGTLCGITTRHYFVLNSNNIASIEFNTLYRMFNVSIGYSSKYCTILLILYSLTSELNILTQESPVFLFVRLCVRHNLFFHTIRLIY